MGEWTGGTDTDTGCNALSRKLGGVFVKAHCSIGDETVTIIADGCNAVETSFVGNVEFARGYIHDLGGFEKFAEYGMRWDQ